MGIKKRFKNQTLQKLYEHMIANPPGYCLNKHGQKITGSTIYEAFWKGFDGVSFDRVVPGSWYHGAWAAGQDFKKQGGSDLQYEQKNNQ